MAAPLSETDAAQEQEPAAHQENAGGQKGHRVEQDTRCACTGAGQEQQCTGGQAAG